MKNMVTKLLASTLMAMLVLSIVPGIGLAAEGGETFVYKADFNETGVPFPTYEMGWTQGENHTNKWVTSAAATGYPVAEGTTTPDDYSVVYGESGKDASDGALRMYAPVKEAPNNYMNFDIPICSGIADSWTSVPSVRALENAMSSAMQEGMQSKWSFEIMKKESADNFFVSMMYRGMNGNLQNLNNVFGIDTNGNITFMAKGTGLIAEIGKWYKIDVIFTYGSNYVDFYINNELVTLNQQIFDNSTPVTNGFKYFNKIQMKVKQSNNTAPSEIYLDNYEISMLSGDALIKTDNVNEGFDLFRGYPTVTSYYKNWIGFANMPAANGCSAPAVKGMFGKSADDVSVQITVDENGNEQTKINNSNPYMNLNPAFMKNWQYGDKIKIGMNIAFDSVDFLPWYSYITMRSISGETNSAAANDGIDQIVIMQSNQLVFGGRGTPKTTKQITWVPHKWYNFEFVFEPGDGETVKNKISFYLDGEYIATTEVNGLRNDEYSPLSGVWNIRIAAQGNGENHIIPGTTDKFVGMKIYADDISYEKMSADEEVAEISVTADESISTGYKNALFIKNNETIGDIKSKITVNGAAAEYVGAGGVVLSDSAPAAGAYLKITSASGSVYYYNIVDKISLYNEDFESYPVIANNAYKLMSVVFADSEKDEEGNTIYNSVSSGKTLGGKSGQAYAFDYTRKAGEYANGPYLDNGRQSSNNSYKFPVADTTTVEFQMFADEENTAAARKSVDWTFEVKKPDGTAANTGINGLIVIENGKIYAGEGRNGNKTYLCDYTNAQWYKIAAEINPDTLAADFYVNGVKKAENVDFSKFNSGKDDFTGSVMTGIMRLKLAVYYNTTAYTSSGTVAFDDIKVYVGSYADSARDAVTVTASSYDVTHEGYIAVNSDEDPFLYEEDFMDNVSVIGDVKASALYDDASYSGKSGIEMNGLYNGNIFVVETGSGTLHYYKIADKATKTDLTASPVLYKGTVMSPDTELDLGTYTLTASIEKYSDEAENYALILAVYADGKLQSVGFAEKALEFGENNISADAQLSEFGAVSTEIKAFAWNGMNTAAPYINPVVWNNAG